MLSAAKSTQWVFGKRVDMLLFGGATLLAFFLGQQATIVFSSFWIYVLFDELHIFSTYFFTYNSQHFQNKFKNALVLVPMGALICSLALFHFFGFFVVASAFAHFSVFHVMKQQCAWFFISSKKEGDSNRFENWVDTVTIWSAPLAPLLLSNTSDNAKGWLQKGDLLITPDAAIWPIIIIWVGSLLCYVALQIKKYHHTQMISWGKHFHLINALVIWTGFRLAPIDLGVTSPFLMLFGHSFPYIFLGYKYVEDRRKNADVFFPRMQSGSLFFIFILIGALILSIIDVTARGDGTYGGGMMIYCIWTTATITHYILDGIMWKSKYHPEGLNFLRQT